GLRLREGEAPSEPSFGAGSDGTLPSRVNRNRFTPPPDRTKGPIMTERSSTRILTVDPEAPEPQVLDEAARVLAGGGLVAFATETVYGLGAVASDAEAVARIFAAKGRPSVNPLIVHVADVGQAGECVAEWPGDADRLAARFWPGPLTLVLRRSDP